MLAIGEKLKRLETFYAQRDALEGEKQALVDQVLSPEVKKRLDEIDAEVAAKAEAVEANIAGLEAEIKADVLAHGESVKGEGVQAVWSKGRMTWDSKGLASYSESHPEILEFQKTGEPSVSLRRT
ncbi:MAG TPA: hypothetical protein VLL77_10235 [Anaerolineales bacterium]|nr:hypothetical protein [Anaerolineales bacterium]